MTGKLSRFVLTMLCCLAFIFIGRAQSHFVYIQSNSGTPFYVKMNDSLLSSTNAGYLVLPQLSKGTYPLIIGFAKKKVPEAAFKISIGDSGDKGFLLKESGGKLLLENIQNKQILQPAEVATSAGNRILSSTVADLSEDEEKAQVKEQTEDPLLALQSDTKPADQQEMPEKQAENNPFEKMLNAVTGEKSTPAPVKKENTPEPAIQDQTADLQQEPAEDTSEKKETLSFSDLINPDKNSQPEKPEAQPQVLPQPTPQEPKTSSDDLTFIDFDHDDSSGKANESQLLSPQKDTLITSAKELRQWEKEKRRAERRKKQEEKKSAFEAMLEQTKSAPSNDSLASPSIANPLFNNSFPSKSAANENPQTITAGSEGTIACSTAADEQQYKKIRRKIASKKSEEAMLRTAKRQLSGEICYTTSQIKTLGYLFGSDAYRFQFLKAAYPYCSDKARYGSLANTLSSRLYQNRLKAFIR